MLTGRPMIEVTRAPAVAGRFYPSQPARLAAEVDALVAGARASDDPRIPKALIAPHAGYVYSGPIAGSAYATLARARGSSPTRPSSSTSSARCASWPTPRA